MIRADSISISKELAEYIVPLGKEESMLLEQGLIAEGCREALIVWRRENGQQLLIDGHNRFRLCQKNNIPFKVKEMSFKDLNEAKLWMIDNQMGRRNLTPDQLSYYRGLRYLSLKKQKGGYRNVALKGKKGQATSGLLSERFDVSESTVKRDAKFAEGLNIIGRSNPKLKARILSGEIRVKKSDIQILSNANNASRILIKNEADLHNKAKNIRTEILDTIESKIPGEKKLKVEIVQETVEAIEPIFLNKEDQLARIKGKIISAVNAAIRNKDFGAIGRLKVLIEKLSCTIFD